MSGAKFETYEPFSLNCSGLFDPSPPKTFAFLPCSSSCCPNVCASGGCCVGKKTMSASLGHSRDQGREVGRVDRGRLPDRRHALLLQHGLGGVGQADRVRLLEVDQDDLLRVQLVDHVVGVGRALDVVTRARPGRTPASPRGSSPWSATSASRTARCARSRRRRAPCWPRPLHPTSPGRSLPRAGSRRSSSERRRDPRRGPSRPGCRRATSCTFSPSPLASVESAYCVQDSCSWPRKPAPPVSGVMIPIFSVPVAVDGLRPFDGRRARSRGRCEHRSDDRRQCGDEPSSFLHPNSLLGERVCGLGRQNAAPVALRR